MCAMTWDNFFFPKDVLWFVAYKELSETSQSSFQFHFLFLLFSYGSSQACTQKCTVILGFTYLHIFGLFVWMSELMSSACLKKIGSYLTQMICMTRLWTVFVVLHVRRLPGLILTLSYTSCSCCCWYTLSVSIGFWHNVIWWYSHLCGMVKVTRLWAYSNSV